MRAPALGVFLNANDATSWRMNEQIWKRVKSVETEGVIGHFEGSEGSMVTLVPGAAHVVHKGRTYVWNTPPEQFSTKPETILDKVKRFLR